MPGHRFQQKASQSTKPRDGHSFGGETYTPCLQKGGEEAAVADSKPGPSGLEMHRRRSQMRHTQDRVKDRPAKSQASCCFWLTENEG